MATIPRKYMMTSKTGLSSIPLQNGQVISIWDNDEVWYDAPANGERDGQSIRRKISGVRVVSTLPDNPMTDIVYVYIGDHGTLPETGEPLYDLRVWVNEAWLVVGNNWEDSFVKSVVSNDKFYLVGTSDINETVGSLLKNSAVYVENGELYGNLRGNADTATDANHATNADLATKAINDNAATPKPILGYLNGSVLSSYSGNQGTQLTFTKGDGTQIKVRTSDTTYQVFTPTASGLVAGTNTTVSSDTTDLILSGSGWIDISNITMPSADSADKDGLGQKIATTYIKSLSYSTSTELLTITQGDNTTSTVSIPDTKYSVFNTSTDGLVPAPSGAGEGMMFLRGDHTWQPITVSDYQGATPSAAGVHGLVPAASLGDTGSYLRSDGTWAGTFTEDTNGLVPGPSLADVGKSLKVDASGNGTWEFCTDTKNTAGATNDITNKLFLVGATSQGTEPQTYSNTYVFVDSNKLYSYSATDSDSVEVVTLSDTQALTNKTYEGYTLGTACEKTVASSINSSTTNRAETFTGDGTTTTFALTAAAITVTSLTVDGVIESDFTLTNNSIVFTTAPANGSTIAVAYTISNPNYNPDDLPKNGAVTNYVSSQLSSITNLLSSKVGASVIGPLYDDTSTSYAANDLCMYDDGNGVKLYKCTSSISAPAGDFDPSKWTVTNIVEVIQAL